MPPSAATVLLAASVRPPPATQPRVQRAGGLRATCLPGNQSRAPNRPWGRPCVRAGASGNGNGSSRGGGGDQPPLPPPPGPSKKAQLELLGMLLVKYPGVYGSLAVAAGYFCHINAFPLHWDSHDALLGLQCALPIIAIDSLLMLPDWSPATTTKVIKLKAPKSVADRLKQREAAEAAAKGQQAGGEQAPAAVISAVTDVVESTLQPPDSSSLDSVDDGSRAGSKDRSTDAEPAAPVLASAALAAAAAVAVVETPDEELVEIERTINVRADQPPVVAALHRLQMDKATSNVGGTLWYPFELALLLTWHLAEEMLYRAVILTCAVGWTIDRLYEAGADEQVSLLGWQLATPQAGALFAAVGCTAVSLAILVQRAFFPLRLIGLAEEELNAKEAASRAGDQVKEERARMRKVLDKVKSGMVRQRRWSTAVEGVRDVTEWAAYSASFLLTGNLLAPYVAAVSGDLIFSGYQRLKSRQVERSQEQAMQTIRELHGAALALKQARKAALEPPPVAGKVVEDADAAHSENSSQAEAPAKAGGGSSSGREGGSNAAPEAPARGDKGGD